MMKSLRIHGVKATAASLGLCMVADVVRGWLWLVGEKQLAAELLHEERRLWA